jgi:predicted RNase H-like nuclease
MRNSGKMREVLIGFDSAWTDSSKNPGAIAAYVLESGQPTTFCPPCLVTFEAAFHFIGKWTAEADYALIAIDQPTVVPNHDGSRPVDRVAGSLVSKLRGGVQPARRGGMGASMFGESAPIWSFLAAVGAIQNPIQARHAEAGRFLMEVFPALALPAIVPEIWQRGRAAKYNPRAKKFEPLDWPIVASGVAAFARSFGASDLANWMEEHATCMTPRKADQDRLDAAICLTIALAWRHGPRGGTLLIGDERTGYMATVISPQTRAVLVEAAAKLGVAVDQVWEGSAASVGEMPAPLQGLLTQPGSSTPQAKEQANRSCPECGHQFKGNGFDGIDAHWRAKHEYIIPYKTAWPLIKSGSYGRKVV